MNIKKKKLIKECIELGMFEEAKVLLTEMDDKEFASQLEDEAYNELYDSDDFDDVPTTSRMLILRVRDAEREIADFAETIVRRKAYKSSRKMLKGKFYEKEHCD